MNQHLPDLGAVGTEAVELWSLRDDVSIDDRDVDRLRLINRDRTLVLDQPSVGVRAALSRMALGPIRLGNVDAGADLWAVLRSASDLFVCSLGAADTGGPVLSLLTHDQAVTMARVPVSSRVRLSRHARLQQAPGRPPRLESSRSPVQVQLQRTEARSIVDRLDRVTDVESVAAETGVPLAIAAAVVEYLVGSGLAVVSGPEGRFADDC